MRISVMGDSISTFEGMNPSGYSVFYEGSAMHRTGVDAVEKTWWHQVIGALGGELCVCGAYSGSRVSGTQFPAASSPQRIEALASDGAPDMILVYMGVNDFGFRVEIGGTERFKFKRDALHFYDAYALMLRRMRREYPEARIICATLMKTRVLQDPTWDFSRDWPCAYPIEAYNRSIRLACERAGVQCADLAACGETYETLDGAHPTARGHQTLAQCWMRAIKASAT